MLNLGSNNFEKLIFDLLYLKKKASETILKSWIMMLEWVEIKKWN